MRITRDRDAPYWRHSDPTPTSTHPAATVEDDAGEPITVDGLRAMAKAACPGSCNKAWRDLDRSGRAIAELERAAEENRDPDERAVQRGIPSPAKPVWCRDCAAAFKLDTGRLPELAAACGARRDGQLAPPPKTDRHGTVVAPPSPSPGWDQVEDIVSWAEGWSRTVAEFLAGRDASWSIESGWKLYASTAAVADPVAYVNNGVPARQLTHWTRYLVGHMTVILSAPFARDYGTELRELVHRSELASSTDEIVNHLRMACLQCGRKALRHKNGADQVRCSACKKSWTSGDFDRLWLAFRQDQERRKA